MCNVIDLHLYSSRVIINVAKIKNINTSLLLYLRITVISNKLRFDYSLLDYLTVIQY